MTKEEVVDATETERFTELAGVPRITDLEEIFAQGSESKSFFDAISLLLGVGIKTGDIYQVLQITDLSQREVNIVAEGLWIAKYGLMIDEKPNETPNYWEIPELKDYIVFILVGRIGMKRGGRMEFAEAIKQFKLKLESQARSPLANP